MEPSPLPLYYNYDSSKRYCHQIGLAWLGDDFVRNADAEAFSLHFTQSQVEAAMRHHLWQVRTLFNPKFYRWPQRLMIAFHFIFNCKRGW